MTLIRRAPLSVFVLTVVLCAGLLTAFNISILSMGSDQAAFSFARVSAVGSLFLCFSVLVLFLLFQKEAIAQECRLILLFGGSSFRALQPVLREVIPPLGASFLLSLFGALFLGSALHLPPPSLFTLWTLVLEEAVLLALLGFFLVRGGSMLLSARI